jgi:ribonuclease E
MEEKRNNRAVERRLKDALRFDRARIQLGRISHFGLMEMSRQRLRTGVLEGSTSQCPHCMGTGIIRSTESVALAVLRGLEDAITAGATGPLIATTTPAVALYILNGKRPYVADMEGRHGHTITVLGSDRVHGANFTVERAAASVVPRRVQHTAVNMDWGFDTDEEEASLDGPKSAAADYERDDESRQSEDRDFEGRRMDGDESNGRRGRRRRRRGRGGRDRAETRDSDIEADTRPLSADEDDAHATADEEPSDQPTIDADAYGEKGSENDRERPGRRRRRGRRGGRRGRDRKQSELAAGADDANVDDDAPSAEPDVPSAAPDEEPAANNGTGTTRKPSRRKSEAKPEADTADAASADAASDVSKTQRQRRIWDTPSTDNSDVEQPAQPAAANGKSSEAAEEPDAAPPQPVRRRHESGSSEPRLERVVVKPGEREDNDVAELQTTPQRKGWWQRKFGGD